MMVGSTGAHGGRELAGAIIMVILIGLLPFTMPRASAALEGPGPLRASSVTAQSTVLSWSASSSDEVLGYRVYRDSASAPADPLKLISTLDAKVVTYTAAGLMSGHTYTFAVAAIDADNTESARSTTTATTGGTTDTSAPSRPSSSSVLPFSSARVDLTWSASSSADVYGYEVLRNGVVVGTVERPAAARFSDNGLRPATSYTYTVRAVDSAGNRSSQTSAKSTKTLAAGTVKIVRGPYTTNVTKSSAVVSWYTNIPAPATVSVAGGTASEDTGTGTLHRVVVSGLSAGRAYTYTATSGSVARTGSFATPAEPGTPFSFAVIGDFGGGSTAEQQNATNIAGFGTDFTQTVGDNVYPTSGYIDPDPATVYSDMDVRIFKQFGAAFGNQSFSFANGNKEYYGDGQFWKSFPMSAPGTGWHSYDWGDAHFLVLDSLRPYGPGSAQYAFAQSDLAASQGAAFRIVVIHNPPYNSVTTSSGSAGVRRDLVPLFEAQNVNLVLSGDTHNYQRSFPLLAGQPVTEGGVTYVTSGGGGNGLNSFTSSSPQPAWQAYRQAVFQTLKIDVSPTALTVSARAAADNSVIDTVTINPSAPDTTAPTAPTALSAAAGSATVVNLAWGASSDRSGVLGYDVYRDSTLLASVGAVTSYTDSTVAPSTTYSYTVTAKDGAGNVSEPSNAAAVTTPADTGESTATFPAVADARVQQAAPTTNYGTSSSLQTDLHATEQTESFLNFPVSGLSGTVTSAKVRLWTTTSSTSPTTNGPALHGVGDNAWTERGLTWANRPVADASALDNKGALTADAVVEYDVTAFVTGNGTYSFKLMPDSTDGTSFNSREGTVTTKRPQLLVSTTSR